MVASILGRVAIVAILGWFIWLATFLIRNDFPKETLDISYAAIGGVVIPAFLLFKLCWIDPVKLYSETIPITVISNVSSGQLSSLFRPSVNDSGETMILSQNGVQTIETIPFFEKFKLMQIENLQRTLISQQPSEFNELLLEEMEFVLVWWMAHFNTPSWLNTTNFSFGLNSAGGTKSSKVPEGKQNAVLFDSKLFPKNRFLAALPLTVILPSDALVSNEVKSGSRQIKILSKYSDATLILSSTGGGVFMPNLNLQNSRIASNLELNPQATFSEYRMDLKWSVDVNKFTRFSDEGKLHGDWFEATRDGFVNAFSTNKLLLRFR